MASNSKAAICVLLTIGISGRTFALGQTAAETPQTLSRIVLPINETKLVKLRGNTTPLARSEFDQGLVDPQLPLERMQLVLSRSQEQEAALDNFMEEQLDPTSPNFHHWLTPEEFGRLYGPSDADIASVTAWLQNHGFQIYLVNKGRTHIEFSGTADQVQHAFHIEMHKYQLNGEEHLANDRDPSIPAALAPVITGIASLHNFFPKHQSEFGGYVKRDRKTGKITPLEPVSSGSRAEFTYTDDAGQTHEDISPWDFATIYNLIPLWNAGIDGAGQIIAISGLSDIEQTDINTFRGSFNLPAKTIQQIHNGTDPGVLTTNGTYVENTLDVEWSGASAKNATVLLVVSASTATTFGGDLSDAYIVDNVDTLGAYIMSASYGGCEIVLGTAGNASINSIFQQGAAEGISLFESAGDQGSTGCDNSDAQPPPAAPAMYGLQVNGDASPPYITAVGGTDFGWQFASSISTYWNSANNANGATAKGYIPELPWNGTCTSTYLLWANSSTFSSSEELCNAVATDPTESFIGLVKVTGGSGGVSACTTSTGDEFSTCGGGYAKPSWQTGTGVPADGKRDLPDLSLFASSGFPDGLDGSAYLLCTAGQSPEESCDYSNPDYIIYQEVGGTSVSSPAMAGIMALVLQKMNGAPQGLANPVFYQLAAADNLTNCNSNTATNSGSCVFYDVTTGSTVTTTPATNAQVCATGARNCVTNTSGDAYGIVSGYNTTTGYDLATGLGSVNAFNLVNAWSAAVSAQTITLSPASLTFTSTAVGTPSAAQTVTVENTGTSANAVTISSIAFAGADPTSFTFTTTCPVSPATLAAGATCTVSITFKPTATGTQTADLEVLDNAAGAPQSATLSGSVVAAVTPTATLTPASLTFASTAEGTTSTAQPVTLKNTSSSAALAIDAGGITITGTDVSSFTKTTTCGTSLAAGTSCTISVTFKPVVTGSLTATLEVADNASDSPQQVALTGTSTAAMALQFIPVTPCRVADTRNPSGPFGGPELAAGTSREFDIPNGSCGIPSTAVAYSLNVTVVPNASLNYLTLWASGQPQPFVSTLNSDGRVKANAAITPAGTNGGVSVFVSDATQVILDIDGYFVPAETTSAALAFYPVTPCRVADTRNPAGPLGGPYLAGNTSRAFPVHSSSCGLLANAQAYSLNVTAVPHSTLNYLTTWPTGETQPYVSTLNSSTGAVTANAAIVPAGSGGDVSVFVYNDADVILDVNGYFASPATGGLSLYTVTPCRAIDTRPNAFNGILTVGVEPGACAPPSTAQAYVLNATVVPVGALNYLTLWPDGGTQPYVSTLNADDGAITSNMAIVPTNNGLIGTFADGTTNLILDISSYFAP